MNPIKIEGNFQHWNSDINAKQDFSVSLYPDCIRISLEGYGDSTSCIQLELSPCSIIPRIIIYGNINIEEPTHIISLENAKDN
jgi:hypothetical protein